MKGNIWKFDFLWRKRIKLGLMRILHVYEEHLWLKLFTLRTAGLCKYLHQIRDLHRKIIKCLGTLSYINSIFLFFYGISVADSMIEGQGSLYILNNLF